MRITANGARLEYADNSTSLLTTLQRGDRFAEIPLGRWNIDARKLRGPEWMKALNCHCLLGVAPANGIPQFNHEGIKRDFSTLVLRNTTPGVAAIPLPAGNAGPQQYINLSIERDTPGPVWQDDKSAPFDVLKTGGRGFLTDGVYLSTCQGVDHYVNLYQGGELPPATGAALDLYNRADVSILNTSACGFETQLKLDRCEATIDNWRGMNCGRSIVVTEGFVPVTITRARIENVLVSGIDGKCVDIAGASVEVGYGTKVGYRPLPNDFMWLADANAPEVFTRGPDLRKWLPERCVIQLNGHALYVEKVEAKEIEPAKDDKPAIFAGRFTFYLAESHCGLPAIKGDGASLVPILGIPFILRGDGNSLTRWTPNINQPIDLPVAAFVPFRKPTKVSHLSVGLMSGWDKKQRALYLGDATPRQFAFQRGVQWNDEPTYAPEHPFVYGMFGPGFDPNKRETP